MKLIGVWFGIFSLSWSTCQTIPLKLLTTDLHQAQLRYFITIYHNCIMNDIHAGGGLCLQSLKSQIGRFQRKAPYANIELILLTTTDPYDASIQITKAIDW